MLLTALLFYASSVQANNIQKQQFWEDAEKGYLHNIGHYKHVNLNVHNDKGQTPLMVAVQNGHTNVVRAFADGIVDITIQDFEGKTAYDYIQTFSNHPKERVGTAMYGSLRVLEMMQIVRGKAKVMQFSYLNSSDSLQITIKGANCDDFLFSEKTICQAKVEEKYESYEIFKVIKSKDNKLLDELLPMVDIEMKDKRNYSLLWRAIIAKNYYAIDQILGRGVDINQKDNNNHHTPVFYAVINNDTTLLELLIKHGVNVNSKNQFGSFVLSTSLSQCNNFEAIAMLLDNGADPYLKDKYGKTVFDKKPVACKDKLNIVQMKKLLKEGSL